MRRPLSNIVLALLVIAYLFAGCNGKHQVTIVPGSRLYNVHMGETIDSVMAKLGKPQLGDAAMGHAWGTWLDTVRVSRNDTVVYRTDIYFVVTGEYLGGIKTVHQIRTTDSDEYAEKGVHVGSYLGDIRRAYPGIRMSAWRPRVGQGGRHDSVITYDQISRGIAFEMVNSTKRDAAGNLYKVCNAIIIHIPGTPADEVYLPLFPETKSLLRR